MSKYNLNYYPEPMLASEPIRVTATKNPRPTGIETSPKASPQYGSKGRQGRFAAPPTGTALDKWDREVAVFEMRKAAWSWIDIAKALDIADHTARKDFRDFVSRRDNDASMKLTAFRELQTARLEGLLQAVWPYATEQDDTPFSHFLKANVRAQDLISEMTDLWGLRPDSGAQAQIGALLVDARVQTIVGLTDAEIKERLREIGDGRGQESPSFTSGVGEPESPEGGGTIDGEFEEVEGSDA